MEFNLIQKFFHRPSRQKNILLGNGDDCTLLKSTQILAFSIDTLVQNTHFTDNISPFDLGYRALAVNLSDLAAMGAKPLAFLLALTLPAQDENWLADFAKGLFSLADQYQLDLIGGNTTQGPLAITIQIIGELPQNQALKRSNAKADDDIYVTGTLGEAAFLLKTHNQLLAPTPRIHFAEKLLSLAHAAIDISDSLTQDLAHILAASKLGAEIDYAQIPTQRPVEFALFGGEDYELCFTAPQHNRNAIELLAQSHHVPLSRIGRIITEPGLWHIDKGERIALPIKGYQHFGASAI